MDRNDREAIEGLFQRLDQVEAGSPPRDAEADALIRRLMAARPNAAYYLAQAVVFQEQALRMAQQRIEELERQGRPAGGLFGQLFGGGPARPSGGYRRPSGGRAPAPWDAQPGHGRGYGPGQGGGFLAGAAQTAMGVAGGVLLGSMLADMFGGGGEAEAAPPDDGYGDSGDFGSDDFGGGEF